MSDSEFSHSDSNEDEKLDEIQFYQRQLSSGRSLMLLNEKAVKYSMDSSLGKSIYQHNNDNLDEYRNGKKRYAHPNDRLECEICGKTFTRANRDKHNKTNHHKLHLQLNKKLRGVLFS